tara:strand:+ start:3356 stop:4282 length:927 start_codon:yes stop_codon:yes gene_type:complete
MAVRRPLILTGNNDLIEMTDAQIDAVKDRCRYLYGANPSVTLSRVSSGGDLGTLTDTRKQAGASTTDVTNFHTPQETPNISTVTVNYETVDQATVNTTASVDTNNIAFPIYYNGSNIQSMTLTDMYDTFIFPAIDTILSAVGQPGTYRIHTSTSLSGYTAVSSDVVFTDTRANAAAYTAGGIGETQDQPTTINDYYLLKANNISAPSMEEMLFIRNSDKNLQEYSQTAIDAILQNCMRHVASEETGSKIRYRWNGTGTILGTGINNTILNGTGLYQTRFVNQNDYRTQEFPNGSAVTANTYYLRMYEA